MTYSLNTVLTVEPISPPIAKIIIKTKKPKKIQKHKTRTAN